MWRYLRPLLESAAVIALCIILGIATDQFGVMMVCGFFAAAALALYIDHDHTRGIFLLSLCIPFERLGSVEFSGMTVRPSQIIAVMLCGVAFEQLLRKKITWQRMPHLPVLVIFCTLMLWSLLNALNIERSLLVAAFTLFTCATSITIPLLVTSERDVRTILTAGWIAYLCVVLFGLYQWVGDWVGLPQTLTGLRTLYTKEILGFPRLQSTALEPLYFANYLLIPLSVLISYMLSKKTYLPLKYLLPSIGLGVLALVLTVARGGYIAFAAACAALMALHIRTLIQPRTLAITGILAVVTSIGVVVLNGGEVITQYTSHVTNLFVGASYNERVHMYELALEAFRSHPFLGIAPGGFGPFASIHPYIVPADGWNIVNNEYLELLAENGALGLLAMLTLFMLVIVRSLIVIVRTPSSLLKSTLVGCLAAFIGILVQYNTFSILYIMHVWFLIGMLIALQNILTKKV